VKNSAGKLGGPDKKDNLVFSVNPVSDPAKRLSIILSRPYLLAFALHVKTLSWDSSLSPPWAGLGTWVNQWKV
jgi:hypothetical protein